jgi:hypothetical protein
MQMVSKTSKTRNKEALNNYGGILTCFLIWSELIFVKFKNCHINIHNENSVFVSLREIYV